MFRRLMISLPVLWSVAAFGVEVTDSTGRAVQVPATISRVLPAGPPAAILLEAIAPDLMIGWGHCPKMRRHCFPTAPTTRESRA